MQLTKAQLVLLRADVISFYAEMNMRGAGRIVQRFALLAFIAMLLFVAAVAMNYFGATPKDLHLVVFLPSAVLVIACLVILKAPSAGLERELESYIAAISCMDLDDADHATLLGITVALQQGNEKSVRELLVHARKSPNFPGATLTGNKWKRTA